MAIPVDEPSGGVPAEKQYYPSLISTEISAIIISEKEQGKSLKYMLLASYRKTVSNCYIKHKTMKIVAVVRYSKPCLCSKCLENYASAENRHFI